MDVRSADDGMAKALVSLTFMAKNLIRSSGELYVSCRPSHMAVEQNSQPPTCTDSPEPSQTWTEMCGSKQDQKLQVLK